MHKLNNAAKLTDLSRVRSEHRRVEPTMVAATSIAVLPPLRLRN